MKIGILTVPFNNNYGGFLQAFALKTILEGMGHEVIFINRQRNPSKSLKFRVYYCLVRFHIIKDYLARRTAALSVNTNLFKAKYLEPITEPFYSQRDMFRCLNMGIGAFVVGSDQVWRYLYAQDSIDDYFFNFLKGSNIPRFSYAASFGKETMDYPAEKISIITQLLKEFCGISVREDSGIELLEKYLGVQAGEAKFVLDPTMLLPIEQYVKLFSGRRYYQQSYLFTYVLDDALFNQDLIECFLREKGIIQVDLKAQTRNVKKLTAIEPVEKWISGIYYSDYVITDSFHGTVFSILFNKPFMVIANPVRGIARLKCLLAHFGLEDRIVTNINTIILNDFFNKDIDWLFVKKELSSLKNESLLYLDQSLNKAKLDIYTSGGICP